MINLFVSHYQCGNRQRQRELNFCLKENEKNPIIDHIYTFSERPTYTNFFEQTEKFPDDINILANADIYFNETLEHIKGIGQRDCYALTRWELDGNTPVPFEEKHVYNKHAKAKHSQDVWIFKGAVTTVYGSFFIGQPGCDNRIAYEILRGRYKLMNPSLTIQAIHKHKIEAREYTMNTQVQKPWKWVEQTALHSNLRKPI